MDAQLRGVGHPGQRGRGETVLPSLFGTRTDRSRGRIDVREPVHGLSAALLRRGRAMSGERGDASMIWSAAYGAAYANAVQDRQRRGDDPLPGDDEIGDLMAVGDCAVEAWQKEWV